MYSVDANNNQAALGADLVHGPVVVDQGSGRVILAGHMKQINIKMSVIHARGNLPRQALLTKQLLTIQEEEYLRNESKLYSSINGSFFFYLHINYIFI